MQQFIYHIKRVSKLLHLHLSKFSDGVWIVLAVLKLISLSNCSSQKVKYVYFRGYFLNAVGDICRNEITGSTEWKYRGVGPIDPFPKTSDDSSYGHRHTYFFGNPRFYSRIAEKFRLSSVTIEYMNGTKKVLSGAELKKRVKYSE